MTTVKISTDNLSSTCNQAAGDTHTSQSPINHNPEFDLNLKYTCHPHTNSSMIKIGTCSAKATRAQVEPWLQGTFGGRFDYFMFVVESPNIEAHYKFLYIAYTD